MRPKTKAHVCYTLQHHQIAMLNTLAARLAVPRSELLGRILEAMLPQLEGMGLRHAGQVSTAIFSMRTPREAAASTGN